jgi:hypothetical protein
VNPNNPNEIVAFAGDNANLRGFRLKTTTVRFCVCVVVDVLDRVGILLGRQTVH